MKTIKKFLFFLNFRQKKHAFVLLVMMIVMALLDMLGVASIFPFVAVLTNPELIETNFILQIMFKVSSMFGVESNKQFLFILAILVFVLLITSLMFKALTTYFQIRFVQMLQYKISKHLVQGYLQQPYSWFLSRHSADLGKNILSEVSQLVGGGINPIMDMAAKILVISSIIGLLIFTDPKLALIICFLLGGAYSLFFYVSRDYIKRIGKKRLVSNEMRFTAVSEAFGAVKEIKVGGLEEVYIRTFSNPSKTLAQTQASFTVLSQLPRYLLEIVAFGGILLIIIYMMAQSGNLNSVLPMISLYVFAGYRLMPAMQQIYNSFTKITFTGPALNNLYYDLKNLKKNELFQKVDLLDFNKTISLKNVFFRYPNSSREALKNINFTIDAKSTVGLVGATGSGKTTTVDIILGLLKAQKGTLSIDGQVISNQNTRAWQQNIGYVPQQIYLSDDTVAANIAFGVNVKDINQENIEKVSKIANLHQFVIEELPKKYQTEIGERGVRLSGGQRQRIGIARALYHNPKVLILDEATSALDNHTEKLVMEAVNNLNKTITTIIIAHRLSTVKNCDNIFLLEGGEIIGQGTFEHLLKFNDKFKIMVNNTYDNKKE